jgi:spore maturation protein CgeB
MSTPEEMAQSVKRFLTDESSRREWIDEASKTITQFHTYSQRMAQFGDWIDTELEKT